MCDRCEEVPEQAGVARAGVLGGEEGASASRDS